MAATAEGQSFQRVRAPLGAATAIVRPVIRHPVSFVACVVLVPAITTVVALALPRQYVAESSLALSLPLLRPETVRLLDVNPATISEGSRYRDPLLPNQSAADRAIARLAARRVPGLSAGEVIDRVQVDFESGAAATVGGEATIAVKARADRPRRAAQLANAYAGAIVAYRQGFLSGEARTVQRIDSLLSSLGGRPLGASERRAAARRRAQRKILADLELNNLRLVTRATPPDGPRSPQPWRDIRVAVVLGIVLWLTVVALLNHQARRVRADSGQERDARNLRTSPPSAGSQASS